MHVNLALQLIKLLLNSGLSLFNFTSTCHQLSSIVLLSELSEGIFDVALLNEQGLQVLIVQVMREHVVKIVALSNLKLKR